MYACPHCDYSVQEDALACPSCDGDLCLLARLHELPDVQFNQALRAARAGNGAAALLQLGAVLAARPHDVDAWVLLGTVCARRGALALARDCWNMARVLRPGEPRACQGLRAI